jgi:hypothetical protein
MLCSRVARWFIFKPKIPVWVNFGGPWNGKYWYMLWTFGIVCGHLVDFFPFWYVWTTKNLSTLLCSLPRYSNICVCKNL